MDAMTKQIGGKVGELYVFGELLKRRAVPYLPLVDAGVDALVRTAKGQVIELQIKTAGSAGGKSPRWFQMGKINPRKNYFVVGVEFTNGEPGDTWIFPSVVFDKYAARPPSGTRDLDLEVKPRKYGVPLRDLLCGFRNRWELITSYEQYEAMMESPEDLEDVLTMKEAVEATEAEALPLEEYERHSSATLSR